MRILMTGSSGLVGQALTQELEKRGHEVVPAIRPGSSPNQGDVVWDPANGVTDIYAMKGIEAVIHLAGENIASGRWSKARKERIRNSRVQGTEALCKSLALLPTPPRVFVTASAVGYYGDRGDERLVEDSTPGNSFLAEVARDWELATKPAEEAGMRVVKMRLGAVLTPEGGALKAMLPPFKLGVGGKMGPGSQYMAWITLRDATRAFALAVEDSSLVGPINTVAPSAITNAQFTKALGKALSRPTIFPLPKFMAKIVIGEMADELLLASMNVAPQVLEKAGFKFLDPDIDSALSSLLKSKAESDDMGEQVPLTSEGVSK